MKRIVLTGGGTAGHVTPNIALLPRLRSEDYEIFYIGSTEGIEKKLIQAQGIPYYGISSGKLRRYFDVKNFTDPFRVLKGFAQASKLMKQLKPDVVFSKGGFVSVPVVMAARRRHIPVICHESDLTPGLANKLSMPSATKVCCNFPETIPYLPKGKAVLTGCPIRQELRQGSKASALAMTGFNEEEVRAMLDYYATTCQFHHSTDELIEAMKPWYDNYCFAEQSYGSTTKYNSNMVLYFVDNYIRNGGYMPRNMVEENIRVDYNKLRMLIRKDKEFAHDASTIQTLVQQRYDTGELKTGFPAETVAEPDNFTSLLFYFGM